jgi:hypothetical protein
MAIVKARAQFISNIASQAETTTTGANAALTLPSFWTEAKFTLVGGGGGGSQGNIAGVIPAPGTPGEMKTIDLPYARYKALGATGIRFNIGAGGAAGVQGTIGGASNLELLIVAVWTVYATAAGGQGGYAPNGNWSGNSHSFPSATGFNAADIAAVGYASPQQPMTWGMKSTTAANYYYTPSLISTPGNQCIPHGHMNSRGRGGDAGILSNNGAGQGSGASGSSGYGSVHFFETYVG